MADLNATGAQRDTRTKYVVTSLLSGAVMLGSVWLIALAFADHRWTLNVGDQTGLQMQQLNVEVSHAR